MMIGREELPREVDDHRFVFAGREAQVLDDGPPMARGIANGERRPFNLHRFPLRDRRVDARVGRKEPTLEKQGDCTGVREWAEVEHEIVRLRNALVRAGDESADIGVVLRAQQRQQISATLVSGGERQLLIANLMDRERAGRHVRWHEALIDEDVHRFGVIEDRKSTRLNSSHVRISYAVFCLKKKKKKVAIKHKIDKEKDTQARIED